LTWVVTGGAGYIGAHVARALVAEGIPTVVVDDLSTGHRSFVPEGVAFVEGDVLDEPLLRRVLSDHGAVGVVHVAGFKYAGVSVQRPVHTYDQNVTATLRLLSAMAATGVGNIVFSSSAATYGTPDTDVVTEASPARPESPYGRSKLVGEWLLADQAVATGLRHTSLRYFNVVGSATPQIYDTSPHNLFPVVLRTITDGGTPAVNGTDYPTPDGTCVRDYLHVGDLARSHVAAARALAEGRPLAPVYNLGSGTGLSVRQIMDAVAKVTGHGFEPKVNPRRPGDPARIVASGELAARDLDWRMRHSVEEMVASAWDAWQSSIQKENP
jgi:UDP-glucose 4-epimerase